jgi:hypothetical protein
MRQPWPALGCFTPKHLSHIGVSHRVGQVEVTGDWRKFHGGWVVHVARMGDRRGAYRVSVGKPQEMRSLRRPRYRCGNNIKIDV